MYQKHKMEFIRFEDNSVWAGVWGPDMSVGDGEELGWPDGEDGDN